MSKLKHSIIAETPFNKYELTEQIGEGGAGRVYSGLDADNKQIAIKVLTNLSSDKKRRFKNEIAFLIANKHPNIVSVYDYGVITQGKVQGPFYAMKRYSGSLRLLLKKSSAEENMKIFSRILDGVEAAHLKNVTHRDLKPENILVNIESDTLAIADFGIANFTEEHLLTLVDTAPTTRLANFQYAAPEQRSPGQSINQTADIYALGLILNELFTGDVPQGTEYQTISSVSEEYAFLDDVVQAMIRQNSTNRPQTISEVKGLIQKHRSEAVTLQKLDKLKDVVIPEGEVSEPLAHEAPQLIDAEYDSNVLTLTLDRPVNQNWVSALNNMGNFSASMDAPPERFRFVQDKATVSIRPESCQYVIDHFKEWLPKATKVLKHRLEQNLREADRIRKQELAKQLAEEQKKLEVNKSLRI